MLGQGQGAGSPQERWPVLGGRGLRDRRRVGRQAGQHRALSKGCSKAGWNPSP